MKKFVSLVLCIVLCLSIFPAYSFAAESYCTITVESASGDPGKNIVINISAKCKNGLKSIALTDFYYDSDVLTLIDGSVTASGAILSNFSLEDKNAVLAFSKNTVLDCVIATLTFSVAENAQPKDYPVTLSAVCKEKTTVETQVSTTVNAGDITVNCKHTNAQAGKGKEPTCLVPGLTAGIFCPDCGTWIVPQQEIKTKAHSFTELKTDGNYHWYKCANCDTINGKEAHKGGTATCTAKAVCSVCSKEYGELKSHSFTVLQSDGTNHWFKCANCTAISGKEAHKGGAATCTAKAVCSVCSKEYGSLKSHSFTVLQSDGTDHWYKCATCDTISGKEAHKGGTATCTAKAKCSVCSKEYGTVLGHDFSTSFTIDKAATCIAAGSKSKHCSRCSATTEVTSIPATGHKFDNACDTTCNICRATRTITHAWNSGIITKAATCTAKGIKTYTCSVCKDTKTEELAALGHDYKSVVTKPTCTKDGFTTYTCSRCKDTYTGNTVKATGHQWNAGVITVEPTAEKEGAKTYTCLTCGTVRTEPVAKLVALFNLGDIDDDGKVTAADARLALRASVGLKGDKDVHGLSINMDDKMSRAFKAGDVDFDDKITAADARLILRASVGLEDPKDWKKA